MKPFYICFEGIDGSGKTYLIKELLSFLKERGVSSCAIAEPFGSPKAQRLVESVEDYTSLETKTLLYLFLAARVENTKFALEKAPKFSIIIFDRGTWSSYAYQAQGDFILEGIIQEHEKGNPIKMDITFFLDTPEEIILSRLNNRDKPSKRDCSFTEETIVQFKDYYARYSSFIEGEVVYLKNHENFLKEVTDTLYSKGYILPK